MIKAEPKPFENIQKYRVQYTFDKVYNLVVEKKINGTTEYEASLQSYVDPDTNETHAVSFLSEDSSTEERAVWNAIEAAVENYCKIHGIGETIKPTEQ